MKSIKMFMKLKRSGCLLEEGERMVICLKEDKKERKKERKSYR